MNLSKLLEAQKIVRKKIIETNRLEGHDLIQNLILALRVELGEMANEQRSWKHWSQDRNPRVDKLLEEYADCLSFTLELALELGIEREAQIEKILIPYRARTNITKMFNQVYLSISDLEVNITYHYARKNAVLSEYNSLLTNLFILGIILGFDQEQIEQAYFEKNAINLKRQENGY